MSRLSCCFASLSLVVVCCSQGNTYSLTECNTQHNFDIVETHETSMTCTGLLWWHHVHWNITVPAANSVETTVARCEACSVQPCGGVCSSSNPNYEISRNFQSTTLLFKNNLNANNGAVVKCSNAGKNRQASCNINVIKAYKLDKCVNDEVEVIEKKKTTIRCSGLDASQNMYWKSTDLDGNSANIAECGVCPVSGSCNTCRTLNNNFRVTRSGEFSDLQIVDKDSLKDGWTITCSKKDDATQDQCNIRVKYYHMPQCQNGTLQIWETQPQTPILCEGLKNSENMNWTITDNNGSSSEIAMCLDSNRKYKCSNSTDFSASRTVTVSQLVIQNYARDKVVNKTLTCVRRDGAREDSCRIRAVYPAEITKRSVTLNGWTVTATAVIDKVYDSDKDVVCLWNMTGPNSADVIEIDMPQLSSFLESSRVYYNGNCSLSISANVTEGVYHVTVIVLPAGSPVAVGNVTLKKPGTLLRLPSCPQYITEGTSLECPCRHVVSLEGSPPATLTWLNHDDTSVLRVSNVRREQNGTTYTCRSVWGPNNDVTENRDYTLLVAYGPRKAAVSLQPDTNNDTATLTCTADDVNPSAKFEWSVPCVSLTLTADTSSCTLPRHVFQDTVSVQCLASNSAAPNLQTTGIYRPRASYQPETPEDKADAPLAFIVGGSVAAAVVIVIIVVIVVIIVKRKDRTYERPRRRRGIPEHTYSDLHPDNNTAPQPLNTAPNTSQNTADNTAHNAADNAADNTAFNTSPGTAPDTETGRVYVNTRSDGASGGAVYYNETSDTQTAPRSDAQDADHYYSEITDLPPVELNGHAALTREADPGMNMSLYEEIK